jgi:hypothetical protein
MISYANILGSSQALTASGATTDVIDFGGDFDKGPGGEVKGLMFVVEVAADFTTGNETYAFTLETDDNTGFSSATTLASSGTINGNLLTAGSKVFVPLLNTNERYIRGYATLGGTTPAITISTYFCSASEALTGGVIYASGLRY